MLTRPALAGAVAAAVLAGVASAPALAQFENLPNEPLRPPPALVKAQSLEPCESAVWSDGYTLDAMLSDGVGEVSARAFVVANGAPDGSDFAGTYRPSFEFALMSVHTNDEEMLGVRLGVAIQDPPAGFEGEEARLSVRNEDGRPLMPVALAPMRAINDEGTLYGAFVVDGQMALDIYDADKVRVIAEFPDGLSARSAPVKAAREAHERALIELQELFDRAAAGECYLVAG